MESTPDLGMQRYYARRAQEYERIYEKPERQADLAAMTAWLPGQFEGRHVLEVACGTGWWTPHGAARAASWLATDVNEEVLAVARTKALPHARIEFRIADAYALGLAPVHDAAFAGFWWSHVPLQRAEAWLDGLHACLKPGATVVMVDNRYVAGSSSPLIRRDLQGNTYQARRLADGSTHEVLKNFPGEAELRRLLGDRITGWCWTEWTHYWACRYTLT